VDERTSFTGINCYQFFFQERRLLQQSLSKTQDLPTSADLSLIIKGRFAEVPPQEPRQVSLWFSQELYSIISALLSFLNFAVGPEYFSFLLCLTFSKSFVQTDLSKPYALKENQLAPNQL